MKKTFVLYVLILVFNCVYGINPQKISSYSVNDGLSINELTCLYQDSLMHYLWIGSQNGLNRYNGHDFKVFKVPSYVSATSNHIHAITEDDQQNLWLATKEGILSFNMLTHTFETPFSDFEIGDVSHLVVLHRHLLVAVTLDQQVLVLEKKAEEWKLSSLVLKNSVIHGLSAVNGKAYFATSKGVMTLDMSIREITLCHHSYKISLRRIKYLPKDNALWLCDFRRVYHRIPLENGNLNFDEIQIFDFHDSSEMAETIHDVAYQNGTYWFSAHEGLLGVNQRSKKTSAIQRVENGYLKGISELLFDNKGNLWCTTWQMGLIKVANVTNTFKSYVIDNQNKAGAIRFIRNFQQMPDGRILVITESDGVYLFHEQKETFTKFEHKLLEEEQEGRNNYIHASGIDTKQRMWLGFYWKGVKILFGKDKNHINQLLKQFLEEKGGYTCDDILVDTLAQKVYIGTNKGLLVYDEKASLMTTLDFVGKEVRTLMFDDQHNLWVGTRAGLYILDPQLKLKKAVTETNKAEQGLLSVDVTQIIQDSNHKIWVATLGEGIFQLDTTMQRFIQLVPPKHIRFDVVYSIIEDDLKTLWMGTNNGIIAYHLTTCKFKRYSIENGVLDHQFNYQSVLKTRNGDIYFGSLNGVIKFNPALFQQEINIPKPIISGVYSDKYSIPFFQHGQYIASIKLPYADNSFAIQFYSPDFTQSNHYLYAYQLQGYHSDWQYTNADNAQAVFSNVPHGLYHLLVKVSLPNSQWSAVSKSPVIIIKPPFYLSVWAYVLYAFLMIALLVFSVGITRYRANMKNNLRIVELKKNNIEALSAAKLSFFTYMAHEIRTPLTLISSPLKEIINQHVFDHPLKIRLLTMKRNAEKLESLLDELLLFRKAEHGQLELSLQGCNIFEMVQRVSSLFEVEFEKKGIVFSISCENDHITHVVDQKKIEMVLLNLIGNALKFTQQGDTIYIDLTKKDEVLEVCVVDSGKGMKKEETDKIFSPFYQGEMSTASSGFGIGLSLSKKIIEAHKGSITAQSIPEKGSVFSFSIPELIAGFEQKKLLGNKVNNHPSGGVFPVKESIKGHILIVEDDIEIQTYLAKLFEGLFKVSVSDNGEKALACIQEKMPDVVISDYQMPVMTGIEMINHLKKDVQTSHIPVILLSAFNEVEDQLKGLKTGANDYIAKPFDATILQYKVQNILAVKQRFIEAFNNEVGFNWGALGASDQQFLDDINTLIKNNMSSQKVDLPFLCEQLKIGRSKLNYKLKSILDITPAEYIKKIRLKEAYRLLQEEQLNVTEAAHATGFSPSYFNTSFKKEFGVSPGNLIS